MFTLRTTGIIIIINTAIIHNTITPGKNIKIPYLLKFTSAILYGLTLYLRGELKAL